MGADALQHLVAELALEPRTTHLLDALREQPRRYLRGLLVERDGELQGAVVVSRLCRDRWLAFPLLVHPDAVAPVATAIERSPAWMVLGTRPDVEPLLPHLTRVLRRTDLDLAAVDLAGIDDRGVRADRRTRFARPDDLDGLVALYASYELDYLPSMRTLRRDLERDISRGRVLLLEDDGVVAGAYRIEAATDRVEFWSHQTIAPSHRGRRLGTELVVRSLLHTRSLGMVQAYARHPTNPTPRGDPDDPNPVLDFQRDVLIQVRLRQRFPRLDRVRVLTQRLDGRRRRRAPVARDRTRWERSWERRAGRDTIEHFEETRAAEVERTREPPEPAG